jgi:hypothetical protein
MNGYFTRDIGKTIGQNTDRFHFRTVFVLFRNVQILRCCSLFALADADSVAEFFASNTFFKKPHNC